MPFVPFVAPAPPSPRANELGRQLSEIIKKYCHENPDMTVTEIRQAMILAQRELGSGSQPVVIALVIALLLLGVIGFFFVNRQPDVMNQPILVMIVVAAVITIGIGFFLKNR
jgi:hypothetical protein